MGFIVGNYVTLALVAVFGVATVFYARAERAGGGAGPGFWNAARLRPALCGLFCAVGVVSYVLLINYSHFSDILYTLKLLHVAALFAVFCGDRPPRYIRPDTKKHKAGAYCFLLAQILLLIPLCILNGVGWGEFAVAAAVLALAAVLTGKRGRLSAKVQKPVAACRILLAFMAAKSFLVLLGDKTQGALLMAAGAALFLAAGLFLDIRSGGQAPAYRKRITCFSGLMLIALSISPEFSASLVY